MTVFSRSANSFMQLQLGYFTAHKVFTEFANDLDEAVVVAAVHYHEHDKPFVLNLYRGGVSVLTMVMQKPCSWRPQTGLELRIH